MSYDHIAKPVVGRYFTYSLNETAEGIKTLNFKPQYSGKRPAIMLENCTVECAYGYQLSAFFRSMYIAHFSLPDLVPVNLAKIAMQATLGKFASIDQVTAAARRDQQFSVYRAFLGPLGKVSITQHVIRAGSQSSLQFRRAAQLSMRERDCKGQKLILTVDAAI